LHKRSWRTPKTCIRPLQIGVHTCSLFRTLNLVTKAVNIITLKLIALKILFFAILRLNYVFSIIYWLYLYWRSNILPMRQECNFNTGVDYANSQLSYFNLLYLHNFSDPTLYLLCLSRLPLSMLDVPQYPVMYAGCINYWRPKCRWTLLRTSHAQLTHPNALNKLSELEPVCPAVIE
jgi:hypothetical protein